MPTEQDSPLDIQAEIVERCRGLGLGQCGLDSVRNFIATAFFHVSLPGTLLADRHVAFNSAIRFATNRIASRGRHGDSIGMSTLLSRSALQLREAIAADELGRKLPRWRALVTLEHQDPVAAVSEWAEQPGRTVDDVVLRLLKYPGAVVTKAEERAIPNGYRHSGDPVARYLEAGIETVRVELGTFDYLSDRERAPPGRRGKYWEPFRPLSGLPQTVTTGTS